MKGQLNKTTKEENNMSNLTNRKLMKGIIKTIGVIAISALSATTSLASLNTSDSIKNPSANTAIYSGYLLGGVKVSSEKKHTPIVIRPDSDVDIKDGTNAVLKQCLMIGYAEGDFATERFAITVTKTICNRADGRQVIQDITGDIWGDDGFNGVKAVLDSKKQTLTTSPGMRVDVVLTKAEEQYNNLLDKVIQEEGRKQLGRSRSNQRLTLEEMKRIDFSKMDISEVMKNLEIKLAGNLQK